MSVIRYVDDLGNGYSGYVDYGTIQVQFPSGTVVDTSINGATGSDAFGRLRVANPVTIFDSQHRYKENNKWSSASGTGGNYVHQTNESAINLNVTSVSGSYIYRQTKKVFPYQPGKSLQILNSFAFAPRQTNLRQRVGLFSTQNGVFLEQDSGTNYFVLRSYVTGSVVDTRIPQSQWNVDPLTGNGPSGITLDTSKANIFWCDIEWLGVGNVRCGFVIDEQLILCHTFKNANAKTTTYMTTAALPLRQELEATNTLTSGTTAKQVCASVVSEGGYNAAGDTYVVDRGGSSLNLATANTTYPVISIRLNSSRLDAVVIPSSIQGIVVTNDSVKWSLLLNPTLTGASYVTHSNGNVDYDITATTLSSGTQIAAGYISKGSQITLAGIADFTYQLGRTIAGVSDVLTLAATPATNNTNVLFSLQWVEVL